MAVTQNFLGNDKAPVSFAQKMASSEAFRLLFREGMGLVEEAAAYLDGAGRIEAKALARHEALGYASESMRLTTRLMQLASWLLLQRAVNEGEMSQAQAAAEKHKVKLSSQGLACSDDMFMRLPQKLRDLASQSLRLQARIIHLDQLIYDRADKTIPAAQSINPVDAQLERLRAAFAPR